MGHFATGVTIITSALDGEVRGMTANSVTSVSLEPMSVLVCINHEALTHRLVSESGIFCVNILSDEQEALSRGCARPDTPEATLQGVGYRVGTTGAPILEGILAYLDCRVSATFEVGTHSIVIGEPIDLGFHEGKPLAFYRGKYAALDQPS
jgi:flavin reductase (DIM6/NTAB) family NADH-FMN oxidoreductase RutF